MLEALQSPAACLPQDAVLYRGASGGFADRLLKAKEGAVFIDRGFVSTTLLPDPAKYGSAFGDTVLIIRAPKGTGGALHEALSNPYLEPASIRDSVDFGEFILPPGTIFRVSHARSHSRLGHHTNEDHEYCPLKGRIYTDIVSTPSSSNT